MYRKRFVKSAEYALRPKNQFQFKGSTGLFLSIVLGILLIVIPFFIWLYYVPTVMEESEEGGWVWGPSCKDCPDDLFGFFGIFVPLMVAPLMLIIGMIFFIHSLGNLIKSRKSFSPNK